ncbi:MAG: signal peptidase II, partial [Thermodesulfovibrionia bacterium]|nr:signal peptidase II [Thermodesulfovibrionia bacterium]
TWHWPAFNVADSALTIGIILFLFANIRQHRTKDT